MLACDGNNLARRLVAGKQRAHAPGFNSLKREIGEIGGSQAVPEPLLQAFVVRLQPAWHNTNSNAVTLTGFVSPGAYITIIDWFSVLYHSGSQSLSYSIEEFKL